MKDYPKIFSTEMVRATLDGRKTQYRKIIRNIPPYYVLGKTPAYYESNEFAFLDMADPVGTYPTYAKYPYGQVGDRLWVKETFWLRNWGNTFKGLGIDYKAGGHSKHIAKPKGVRGLGKWKSAFFMPKWAARIFLEITNIRVERVQDISEEDAKAEGIYGHEEQFGNHFNLQTIYAAFPEIGGGFSTAREAFELLWDSINAKRDYGWDKNPWVWVIEFKRISKEAINAKDGTR